MLMDVGASAAIIHNGQILLTKRRDVEAWALPGGHVEVGETVAEAARREAQEETGLKVRLHRLVGIYCLPQWPEGGHLNVLFSAEPIGGELRPQESEVLEMRFCEPDALPEPLVWWHRQRIRDALSGSGGSAVWLQQVPWPFESRRDAYERLMKAGPSAQALFLEHFAVPEPRPENLEVCQVGTGPQSDYYPMPSFPTLSTSDLGASREFYVDGLGFQHVCSIPGPDGQPVVEHIRFTRYADLLLERESLSPDSKALPRGRGVRFSFSLPLAGRSAGEIAGRARSLGGPIEGPVERAWNVREVVVTDPDGYTLVFTEPLDTSRTMEDVLDNMARAQQPGQAPEDPP